jgi:hypothetical protein
LYASLDLKQLVETRKPWGYLFFVKKQNGALPAGTDYLRDGADFQIDIRRSSV